VATIRTVAIGDVHGDLDALIRILLGMAILGDEGQWVAQATRLVLLGDLNDRGPESVNVMDFVISLATEAQGAGCGVDALLGNHELLAVQQDYRYVLPVEFLALEDFYYNGVNGVDAIYRGNSPYAVWIRNRPTILRLEATLFVHAGLEDWAHDCDPSSLNALISNWVAYFQGVADSPAESTLWLIQEGQGGPLWTRRFGAETAPDHDPVDLCTGLHHVLARLGVDRMVVGHVPTKVLDYAIAFPHPTYGDRVAVIDTGISRSYGGRLSALEIDERGVRPHYFDRGTGDLEVTEAIRSCCVSRRNAFADKCSG
jgi:Calcineurin-like phosphoesterase